MRKLAQISWHLAHAQTLSQSYTLAHDTNVKLGIAKLTSNLPAVCQGNNIWACKILSAKREPGQGLWSLAGWVSFICLF